MPPTNHFRLGIDIGGTFTDIVVFDDEGRIATHKISSTPEDYGRAIVAGVSALLAEIGLDPTAGREVVHGTTVATNAILEGRGAPTGLITTRGFRDNLEIGRLRYPRLYDLTWSKPPPLVPRRWRVEVGGRLGPRGEEVDALDEASVRQALAFLVGEGVGSLAVALIHSYANPAHERRVAEIAAEVAPGVPIVLSSDVLPEIGEYERTSTTVIDAYLRPVVSGYLERLTAGLAGVGLRAPVLVMQSSGGVMSADAAAAHPVHVVESGPAAGVIAAQRLAEHLGVGDAITLDMGGTTAKASIVEGGQLLRAREYEVGGGISVGNRLNRGAGYILRVSAIDVAEVGAGGGSVVWIDPAGALHVGPRSAGAVPGPLCYGVGLEPTLTDANLLLGYLNPTALLGGALPIDRARAADLFESTIARPLGLDVLEAAHGVHRIGVASMVRVVKAVSSERGRDPRRFALVAFGGNGPLHGAAVADELGIRHVVVPPWPGLFSAFGLLVAEPARHFSRTILRPTGVLTAEELEAAFTDLERLAAEAVEAEGAEGTAPTLERWADVRYVGQSYELRVPVSSRIATAVDVRALEERFGAEHERTYGHRAEGDPIEVVHVRLTASVPGSTVSPWATRPGSRPVTTGSPANAADPRQVYFGRDHGLRLTPVLGRADVPEAPLPGPVVVEEYDATTLVPPGWSIRRGTLDALHLEAR